MATGSCSRLFETSPWRPLGSVFLPHWHWGGDKGSGPGGGQLPLGPLHYLVLNRKKQLELSKASHRGADTASNSDWSSGSLLEDQTRVLSIAIKKACQVFCLVSVASPPPGNVDFRASRISFSNSSSHASWSVMAARSDLVDAADAR